VHGLGDYKKAPLTYIILELKLKTHFPVFYDRVNDLLETVEI
jgi:hypothetical protein